MSSFSRIDRRRMLGLAASAAVLRIGSASAQSAFGPIKQIDAGDLSVGYADVGPADGKPVLLLHGWPYDIHAFAEVAPRLAAAGYRAIVPFLRGYGAFARPARRATASRRRWQSMPSR